MNRKFYVADIGNSRTKIAKVKDNQLLNIQIVVHQKISEFNFDSEFSTEIIVSSVNPGITQRLREKNNLKVYEVGREIEIPVKNLTHRSEQTGIDRLVNVFAASKLFPNTNVIAMDAGTAITYDVCSEKGEFLGGVIQAGYDLQLKTMHDNTAKLPMLEFENVENIKAIGKTTEEAMLASVKFGIPGSVLSIIQAIIAELNNKQTENCFSTSAKFKIIFTGGSGEILYKSVQEFLHHTLKKDFTMSYEPLIHSIYEPYLTLKGLMFYGLQHDL